MIPQHLARRVHRQVRLEYTDTASTLLSEAGLGTADYVIAHRIPKLAKLVLQLLPAKPAARLLASAISKNAWTFVGSGTFRVINRWTFEIENNPLIAGEVSDEALCAWHVAVFERLYRRLVSDDCRCTETECAATGEADICRFEIRRQS